MPFCTECGARHDESARTCPKCGAAIAVPPDDDLDNLIASMDTVGGDDDAIVPGVPESSVTPQAYLEEIQGVRGTIATQSTALQGLTDLSWSNPEANAIREQLATALERLHALTPPPALAGAHEDFVDGAELLARGFGELVDATEHADTGIDRGGAEQSIAEATERFLRGANAINDYLMAQDDGDHDPTAAELEPEEIDEISLEELEQVRQQTAAAPTDLDDELDELDLPPMLDLPPEPTGADDDDPIPPLPPELEDLPPLPAAAPMLYEPPPVPRPVYEPPAPRASYEPYTPPAAPVPSSHEAEAWAGADTEGWPTVGDPQTDGLMLEIEGGWVRARGQVYEAIERAVRASVSDALRGALATRMRIEQEARASLSRIAGERSRLLDEVEALRREAHGLQSEMAELRRAINELERERQLSQDRRHQMFQDAETQRNQLLKEIESLGGQLEAMRRNIVSLLNMSAEATALAEASGDEPPALAAPARAE